VSIFIHRVYSPPPLYISSPLFSPKVYYYICKWKNGRENKRTQLCSENYCPIQESIAISVVVKKQKSSVWRDLTNLAIQCECTIITIYYVLPIYAQTNVVLVEGGWWMNYFTKTMRGTNGGPFFFLPLFTNQVFFSISMLSCLSQNL
jgi:hypothetical protein